MDDLKQIMKLITAQNAKLSKLEKLLEKLLEKQPEITSIKNTSENELPKKSKPKSVSSLIIRLAEDGFLDTPKTLKEISDELKRGGHYYSTTSMTLPLQRLLHKRDIGRMSINGKWAYVKR